MTRPRRTLAVVPSAPADLTSLAQEILEEHELSTSSFHDAKRSLQDSVLHAVNCGAKLHAAKALAGHGNWLKWLAQNVPAMSERTAQDYMRLSRDERTLEIADLGITGVLEAIRQPRDPNTRAPALLPAGERPMFDDGPPLSAEAEQEIRDGWWRQNQRMAADPAAREWAHLGIAGVLRVCHDQDPETAARLGDDLVTRMKAWNSDVCERGFQQVADAPFLMAANSDDVIAAWGAQTTEKSVRIMVVGAMLALHRPPERIEQFITTPSRPALERALTGAMRMLREQRREDVLAAVERWKTAA